MDQIIFIVVGAFVVMGFYYGDTINNWVKHLIETRRDEREERQANARAEMRHRHRLEKAEKLETVVSILIADESMAKGLRDKIDAEFPKARVEVEKEEEEDDYSLRRMKKHAGRSKR